MSAEAGIEVNVEKIMEEIRRNIQMEEDLNSLPPFDDIPIRGEQPATTAEEEEPNWEEFYESLEYTNKNYTILYYWEMGPRGIKTFIKRIVRKLAKCILLPIVVMQSELNARFVRCHNAFRYFSENVRRKLSGYEEKFCNLQNRADRFDEKLKRLSDKNDRVLQRLNEVQSQLNNKEELRNMEQQITALNQQLTAIMQTLEEEKQHQSATMQALEEEKQRQSATMQALKEEKQRHSETMQALEEEKQCHAETVQRLKEIEQLQSETVRRLDEIEQKQSESTDQMEQRLTKLDRRSDMFSASVAKTILTYKRQEGIEINKKDESMEKPQVDNDKQYQILDYFKFQNDFRGTRAEISERQEMYLPYFQNKTAPVLDIGCGRGEFLQLLKENAIPAIGVDLYPEYAVEGELNGVDVRCGDGIEFLKNSESSFGGIFCAQVIEHTSFAQLQELCAAAYEKLLPDAYLVIETPNPTCVSMFTSSFYIDPTHNKPIHPLLLEYLLREVGFEKVSVISTEASKVNFALPKIDSSEIKNLDEVNAAIGRVSEFLYGSLDYAVIAKK